MFRFELDAKPVSAEREDNANVKAQRGHDLAIYAHRDMADERIDATSIRLEHDERRRLWVAPIGEEYRTGRLAELGATVGDYLTGTLMLEEVAYSVTYNLRRAAEAKKKEETETSAVEPANVDGLISEVPTTLN